MRRPLRILRGSGLYVLGPLLLAHSAAAQESAGEGRPSGRPTSGVAEVLQLRQGPEALADEQVVLRLVGLGTSHLEEVLDLLLPAADAVAQDAPAGELPGEPAGEPPPEFGAGPGTGAFPAGDAIGESTKLEPLLLGALRAWPRTTVLAGLLGRVNEESSSSKRLEVAAVLGRLHGEGLLDPLLELLRHVDPVVMRGARAQALVRSSLASVLATDGFAHSGLAVRLDDLDPGLLACLAAVLAQGGRTRDVELLMALLGRDETLTNVTLAELANLRMRSVVSATSLGAERVMPFLEGPNHRQRKLAILALGQLHHAGGAKKLIELLRDPSPGVAPAALRSLQTLSGLHWRNAPERWSLWLEAKQTWLEEQAPELGWVLATGDPTEAIHAARELAQHPLFRDRVAELLRAGLGREESGVVRTTCAALCGLGSLSVARALVPLLSSQEQTVCDAACAALETLVGERLGSKPQAWNAWLDR
ncbi:MAG: hypothetical protein V3T22_13060 [Planctomycetota bacterium]